MKKSHGKFVQAAVLMLMLQRTYGFDVHGIHIGDRWDSDRFEQALTYPSVPSQQRVKCSRNGEERCAGATHYLDADIRLTIEGKDGRVRKITMTLPTDDFDNEVAALKREFGPPTNEWSSPAGATAPLLFHHRVDWRLANEELFGLKFSAMATISLTRPEESIADRYPSAN